MSTSNIFSNVFIYGNCTVQGTFTSLGGSAVSQWTTSGSVIYYSSGNVGVGLTNPSSILNVNVTGSTANIYNTTTGSSSSLFIVNTADNRRVFVGMDGTGLFAFSTGALALGTDNTPIVFAPNYGSGEKMRITTTGLVGIGTNNPGSLLTVSGGVGIGSGYNAFTAPTNGLIVQGNVGIGTSNPGLNALQVSGNVVTSGFTSNATNTVFNFDTLTVPFVNATQVGIGNTAPTALLDIRGGSISLGSYDSSSGSRYVGFYNVNDANGPLVGMEIENTTLTGNYSQKLHFRTHWFGTNNGRRMTITEGGNVGIGTASPGALLDVQGGAIRVHNPGTSTSSIEFKRSSDNWNPATIQQQYNTGAYGGDLAFQLHPADSTLATAPVTTMYLKAGGNVGIGTTNPLARFHITGDSGGGSGYGALLVDYPNSTSSGGCITIRNSAGGTGAFASLTFEVDGSTAVVSGNNTSPIAFNQANGFLYCQNMGTAYGGVTAGKMGLQLWNGSAEFESQTWLPNGNVGIGTTNPTRPLHIYGSMRLDMNAATYSTQSATQAWTGGTWYQLVAPGALTNLAQGTTIPTTYLISMTWNTTANNPYNLYCSFLYNCGWCNDGNANQLSGAPVPTSYHATNNAGDFQVSIRGNATGNNYTGFDFKVNATTTTGYWIVKAMIISYY